MSDETKDPQGETPITPPVTEPQVAAPVEEPFDKDRAMATIEKLRAIEKQHKQDKKELERLQAEEKKRADAQLSETERLQKERDAVLAENARIKSDLLRRDVINEIGLPAIFVDRLKGETKDEMLADAQALLKTLPQLKTAPKVPPTNPGKSDATETELQKRARLFGAPANPFDFESVKAQGGGVVNHK